MSNVRQDEEFRLVGFEQAIRQSVIEQNFVGPAILHSIVHTASFDEDDLDSGFLKLPRRGDAGLPRADDADLS